jgi:hypothetical protein
LISRRRGSAKVPTTKKTTPAWPARVFLALATNVAFTVGESSLSAMETQWPTMPHYFGRAGALS